MTPKFLVCAALFAFIMMAVGCASVAPSSQVLRAQIDETRRLGHTSQALYQVEALAQRDGWSDDLAYIGGALLEDMGDLEGSLALWARIESPDAARLRDIARLQVRTGRWTVARETYDALTAQEPSNAWAQLQSGILYIATAPERARAALRNAGRVSLYADQANALLAALDEREDDGTVSRLMRVGLVLVEQGGWAFAEMCFAEAAALDAPYPEALAALGFTRVMQGKDGAEALLDAIALAPDNPRVRYFQGIAARVEGDWSGALDALSQAVGLEPNNAALYAEVAQTYRAARDLEAAERWFLQAVDVSGDAVRYREILALFYADEAENLTTSGVQALQDLLGVLPPSADAQAGYGWAMYLAGDVDLGRDLIARALAVEPDNPRALYYQARILIDEGNTAEAASLLRRVELGDSAFSARAAALLEGMDE
jgi:tetratricopeptide (TPR) repeat protein